MSAQAHQPDPAAVAAVFNRMSRDELARLQTEEPEQYAQALKITRDYEPPATTEPAPAPDGVMPAPEFEALTTEQLIDLQRNEPDRYAASLRHWATNPTQQPIAEPEPVAQDEA